MNTEFIQAVRRMVERGNPPKLRASSPGAPRHPVDPFLRPPAVQGVSIQKQLNEVAWSVSWEAVPGASGYELQTNPDPSRLMRWFARGRVMQPAAQVKLSAIGSRLWLRVRAFGLTGIGPWSDPILLRKGECRTEQAA